MADSPDHLIEFSRETQSDSRGLRAQPVRVVNVLSIGGRNVAQLIDVLEELRDVGRELVEHMREISGEDFSKD